MAEAWYSISYFTLTLITFVCHSIGLVVLMRVKSAAVNQRIIIINLALTEILFCANQLAYYAAKNIFHRPSIPLVKVNQTVRPIFHTANKLVMIHLTLDRFADIYLSLKYALYFSRKQVIKILGAIWIASIAYGVILGIIMEVFTPHGEYPTINYKVNFFVSVVLDIFITLSAVCTYSYLFHKVRNIMTRDITLNNTKNRSTHPRIKFLIPLLMIATYLAFNVTGTFIQTVAEKKGERERILLIHIAWFMIGFGYLTDAALYVFLQKDVRSFITTFTLCKRRTINRLSKIHLFQRNMVASIT